MKNNRKVILFIAASLDGFIAKPNDDLEFLSIVEEEGQDYGYFEFVNSIDTVIMGRRTYDWVMSQVSEFPHADKKTFIITRTPKPDIGNIRFYTGDLEELINQLKQEQGKNIFIDGGAEIVNLLMKERLIDDYIISIIPIFVGDGIKLFQEGIPEQKLKLISTKSFPKGLVQLHYQLLE
jgi:dihydrofolate reductase